MNNVHSLPVVFVDEIFRLFGEKKAQKGNEIFSWQPTNGIRNELHLHSDEQHPL